LLLIGGGLLFLSGGGSPFAPSAPFKADKLSVLIVEETAQRTPAIDAAANAVKQAVDSAKGNFRRFDKDQTDFANDEPWVAEAWKAKGSSVPWIVGSNGHTGVNQSLPAAPADAVKLLSPMGVK
jgi:hypothetical protein